MTSASCLGHLVLPAPAKINLALCIGAARDDGFHDLVSVFQAIDLHDTVTLADDANSPEIRVTSTDPGLAVDERNTATRAARGLRDAYAPGRGAGIHLEKRIPSEAGMGGGSSDAAAVLLGLNRLWGLGLSPRELLPLAAAVGSDVPFFLTGGCALVRGRGERVEPLPVALRSLLVVARPHTGVSTARAYRDLDAMRAGAVPAPCDDAIRRMCAALRGGRVADIACALRNDLEAPVLAAHPEIAWLKGEMLAAGAAGALLSGSGSAVFGVFASAAAATAAAAEMARRWPWARETRPWKDE